MTPIEEPERFEGGLNLIFENRRFVQALGSKHELFKRGVIQNFGGRITDLLHDPTNHALLFVRAIIAARVSRLADAGNSSKRSIDQANHACKGDGIRGAFQKIAALFAFAALEHAFVAKIQQNGFQEFFRDMQRFRNLPDLGGTSPLQLSQIDKSTNSVLCSLGKYLRRLNISDPSARLGTSALKSHLCESDLGKLAFSS